MTWVIVGVVVLVAVAGAVGSIYNLTGAAEKAHRSAISGIAGWAGAEGAILVAAALAVVFAWRGQLVPGAVRGAVWIGTGFAIWLNVDAVGGLEHLSPTDIVAMLAIAAPVGTAAGLEGLSLHCRSAVDMRTGADQHASAVAHRHDLISAYRWSTRAAAWENKRGRGSLARYRARVHTDALAVDDPDLAATMQEHVTAFVSADAAFSSLPNTPASQAPAREATLGDEEPPPIESAPAVTLERADTIPAAPPAAEGPHRAIVAQQRREIPPADKSFDEHVRSMRAAITGPNIVRAAAKSGAKVTAKPPEPAGEGEAEPEQAGENPPPESTDEGCGLVNGTSATAEETDALTVGDESTTSQVSVEKAESPTPPPSGTSSPETAVPKNVRLANANKARAEKARVERIGLAAGWWEAIAADGALTKAAFAAARGISTPTLNKALRENPRP
ncbi:DUF2637 domain-containing protein [Streptomyces noursei]|uniref:DUF2637 domain-containing protein n=1 Tax=Streptomyces noursei TaxID=1971 RepID=UPI0038038B35